MLERDTWYKRLQLEHPWLWGALFGAVLSAAMALPSLFENDPPGISDLLTMFATTTILAGALAGFLRSRANRRDGD